MMSQAAGNRSGPTQSLLKSFISLLYTIGIRTNCLNSIRGVRLLQPMKEKMVPWISHFEGGQNQDTLRKLPKCFTPVKMVGTWRTLGELISLKPPVGKCTPWQALVRKLSPTPLAMTLDQSGFAGPFSRFMTGRPLHSEKRPPSGRQFEIASMEKMRNC